jgi:hypothetical protein
MLIIKGSDYKSEPAAVEIQRLVVVKNFGHVEKSFLCIYATKIYYPLYIAKIL